MDGENYYLSVLPSPSEPPQATVPPAPPQRRLVDECPLRETAAGKANYAANACYIPNSNYSMPMLSPNSNQVLASRKPCGIYWRRPIDCLAPSGHGCSQVLPSSIKLPHPGSCMYSRKGIRKIGYHFQKMYRLYITYETSWKYGGRMDNSLFLRTCFYGIGGIHTKYRVTPCNRLILITFVRRNVPVKAFERNDFIVDQSLLYAYAWGKKSVILVVL